MENGLVWPKIESGFGEPGAAHPHQKFGEYPPGNVLQSRRNLHEVLFIPGKEYLTSLFVLIAAFETFLVSFIFAIAPGCSLLASLRTKNKMIHLACAQHLSTLSRVPSHQE